MSILGIPALPLLVNPYRDFDFSFSVFREKLRGDEVLQDPEILAEINRLKKEFEVADENKLRALDGLIEQAAYERVYLQHLDAWALKTGLVEVNPLNPKQQRVLPVSGEIAKHSATLTNITDKLMKYLAVDTDDDDSEALLDYE